MRPPFEYVLDKGAVFERVLYTPGTYEPDNPTPGKRYPPARLRVEWDPDYGPVNLFDEDVTSEAPGAQQVSSDNMHPMSFTGEEARWLHRTLGELIARWDAEEQ